MRPSAAWAILFAAAVGLVRAAGTGPTSHARRSTRRRSRNQDRPGRRRRPRHAWRWWRPSCLRSRRGSARSRSPPNPRSTLVPRVRAVALSGTVPTIARRSLVIRADRQRRAGPRQRPRLPWHRRGAQRPQRGGRDQPAWASRPTSPVWSRPRWVGVPRVRRKHSRRRRWCRGPMRCGTRGVMPIRGSILLADVSDQVYAGIVTENRRWPLPPCVATRGEYPQLQWRANRRLLLLDLRRSHRGWHRRLCGCRPALPPLGR